MAPDRCPSCRSRWCTGAQGYACAVPDEKGPRDSVGLYPHKIQFDEEFAKAACEIVAALEKADQEQENMIEQTGKKCRIPGCNGAIIHKYEKRYDPSSGPMIIGPGSKSQFRRTLVATCCETCKIMYAHDV